MASFKGEQAAKAVWGNARKLERSGGRAALTDSLNIENFT